MPNLTDQQLNLVRREYLRLKGQLKYFPRKVSEIQAFYRQQNLPSIIIKLEKQQENLYTMLVKKNRIKLFDIFHQVIHDTLDFIKQYLQKHRQPGGDLRLQRQIQQIIIYHLPELKGYIHLSNQIFKWYAWKSQLKMIFQRQFNLIKEYYQIVDQKGQSLRLIEELIKDKKPQQTQKLVYNKFIASKINQINLEDTLDLEEEAVQQQFQQLEISVIKASAIRLQKESGDFTHCTPVAEDRPVAEEKPVAEDKRPQIKLSLRPMKKARSQTPVEQKKINSTSNLSEQHCLNLQNRFVEMAADETKMLKQYCLLSRLQLKRKISNQYSDWLMSIIRYSIKKPAQKLKQEQGKLKLGQPSKLLSLFNDYEKILLNQISDIKVRAQSFHKQEAISKQSLYLLVVLFYKCFKNQYTVVLRHYIRKVCLILQAEIEIYHLRRVLKIVEQFDFQQQKMSVIAKKLSREPAERSINFKRSQKSLILIKQYTFQKHSKIHQETEEELKKIQNNNEWPIVRPEIEFIKLNQLHPDKISKIINLAISGYLSQNTAKDLEWEGLIRAVAQSSELYGVRWPSSTLLQTLKFALNLGAKVIDYLLSFVSPSKNIRQQIQKIVGKDNFSTFQRAFNVAKLTGQYIADFLMQNFSDRFVNLIAFSLGTVVVFHCLKRLSDCGKLHLINRVVTLGGVADQKEISQFLKTAEHPLFWTNIKSDGDIIVKVLFKLYSFSATPIGAAGIPLTFGHDIVSLQMGDTIGGHLDFRCYLEGIGSMIGLHFD